MNLLPIKTPSAWVPMVMSLAALGLLLGHLAIFGVIHEADEGAAVHTFWLLMGLQIPVILYFAVTWLPKKPKQALSVLVVQRCAWILAWVPVFLLEKVFRVQ